MITYVTTNINLKGELGNAHQEGVRIRIDLIKQG